MLNRQTLFGSRDNARDQDRGVLTTQTKPNPAQPPSPAAEAVRANAERIAHSATERQPQTERQTGAAGSEIPAMPRATNAPAASAPPVAHGVPSAGAASAAATHPSGGAPTVPSAAQTSAEQRSAAGTEARMVVGPNIKMRGVEINDCDTLIVEGTVEATMDARQIEVAPSGSYTGKASVDNAEIHGLFTGELTVRKRLQIHATGKVGGTLRYGKMIVEEGGEIAGDIRSLAGENRAQPEPKPFVAETKSDSSRGVADALPVRR